MAIESPIRHSAIAHSTIVQSAIAQSTIAQSTIAQSTIQSPLTQSPIRQSAICSRQSPMAKVTLEIADGVCLIELNDPPANTYSYEMMQEIDAAVLEARMDHDVHVIVLRGAGEKFFCAGANIAMLKEADPDFKYYFCLHANETLNRL